MGNPLTPEQLSEEGQRAYNSGDYTAAAQAYQAAAQGYQQTGDSFQEAELLNNASVAYLKAGDPQLALDMALHTDQVFASDGDLRRQAIALANQAAAYQDLGQLEKALQVYQESSALLREIDDQELRPAVMKAISSLQLRLGKQMEALATMQSSLDVIEKPSLKQKILKKILQSPFRYFTRLN